MHRGSNIEPTDKYIKNMAKQLLTTKGTGRKIAKLLGVSEHTVSFAVRGKIDTDTARKIRKIAKENYGAVEVETN